MAVVSVNPGWPVAVALVLLMTVTVLAYAVASFPGPLRAVVAGARSVAQLGAAALVIAWVVRDVRLSAGAGFVVAICGEIMTMPGLPRVPAADTIRLDANGQIDGLF